MVPVEFQAPWSRALRVTTVSSAVLLLLTMVCGIMTYPRIPSRAALLLICLPSVILMTAIPFAIRGYVLTERAIIVKRLGWETTLPLTGLNSVGGDVEAMRGSLRLLGNGGLFSFSGEFWSRRLGRFRALATDPQRAVVLRYSKRTVVITPHDPQHFIVRARTLLKTAQFPG